MVFLQENPVSQCSKILETIQELFLCQYNQGFTYLIPITIRAPLNFAPLIFAPLIFAHPRILRLFNFRAPLFLL